MMIRNLSLPKLPIFCFCFCIHLGITITKATAQIGGRQTFEFLRIPTDARLAGLGGVNVSLYQGDVSRFQQNPALLDDSVHHHAAIHYSQWQADINNFDLVYARKLKSKSNLGFAARVVNYGEFERTDPSGQSLGSFQANDFALSATYARQQDAFHFGATMKFLGSQIDVYQAYALAFDIGGQFKHPKQDLRIGLSIQNLGFTLSKYTPESRSNLPFDVQIGTSFKPRYMPFRFSITLHHLYQFDIVFLDPNLNTQLDVNGNPVPEEKNFAGKLFRHFVFGGELIIKPGFQLLVGYNHLINREMQVEGLGNLRGFSFGFNLQVKAFRFAISRGTYHVGAGRTFFSLTSNLNRVFKKKGSS